MPSEERFVAVVEGKCESNFGSNSSSLNIENWLPYCLMSSAPIPSISNKHSRRPGLSAIPSSLVVSATPRAANIEFDSAAKFRGSMALSCPNSNTFV